MSIKEIDRISMGVRIRKHRELLGLSREQLAEKLDVTGKFVNDIECGSKGLSLKRLCALTQALGVSADYLLFGDDANTRRHLICEIRYYVE